MGVFSDTKHTHPGIFILESPPPPPLREKSHQITPNRRPTASNVTVKHAFIAYISDSVWQSHWYVSIWGTIICYSLCSPQRDTPISLWLMLAIPIGDLPFSTYAPRGRGEGQVSYTFSLRITCGKKGGGSR